MELNCKVDTGLHTNCLSSLNVFFKLHDRNRFIRLFELAISRLLWFQVQESVSNCLPHLVCSPALEGEIPAIMNKLMKQLLTAEKYGDRKVDF